MSVISHYVEVHSVAVVLRAVLTASLVIQAAACDRGPTKEEFRQRLDRVGLDRGLVKHPESASLVKAEPVLCSDSSPPTYRWRYRLQMDADVDAFYDTVLPEAGWRRREFPSNVTYEKRFDGWQSVADIEVNRAEDGYTVSAAVDDGYESGC